MIFGTNLMLRHTKCVKLYENLTWNQLQNNFVYLGEDMRWMWRVKIVLSSAIMYFLGYGAPDATCFWNLIRCRNCLECQLLGWDKTKNKVVDDLQRKKSDSWFSLIDVFLLTHWTLRTYLVISYFTGAG